MEQFQTETYLHDGLREAPISHEIKVPTKSYNTISKISAEKFRLSYTLASTVAADSSRSTRFVFAFAQQYKWC